MSAPDSSTVELGWGLISGIVLASLGLSAFFSGTETGYLSVSRVRLRQAKLDQTRSGRLLTNQLRRIEEPITTCLIGTNLTNVIGSAAITMPLVAYFGHRGEWLAVAIESTLVILLGEILPKVLYREYPERLTLASVPILTVANGILTPVRWLLRRYVAFLRWCLPAGEADDSESLDRRNLAALMLTNVAPTRDDNRFSDVLDSFLHLANLTLGPVMRPLGSLQTVGPDDTVRQCLDTASVSGFSRLPITDDVGHQLQGYVLVRDLLFVPRKDQDRPVPRKLWRSFLLVDVRMSPYELFEELRSQGHQIAVVLDPSGNALGLITLEDLIETVIGSIHDEFDPDRVDT